MRRSAALWIFALAVGASALAAYVPDAHADEAEGRRRWSRGRELYEKGRWLEAAREFEAGYATAPRPLFLLNIGHAYRRAQELSKAKSAYQQLLKLQPDFPQRAEVEANIKSIDDALTAAEAGLEAPPRPQGQPAAPQPALALVDPSSALPAKPMPEALTAPEPAAPSVLVERRSDEPPASDSVFRKPWFWVIVGTVVAGGIATAIIVSRPGSSCPAVICIKEGQ